MKSRNAHSPIVSTTGGNLIKGSKYRRPSHRANHADIPNQKVFHTTANSLRRSTALFIDECLPWAAIVTSANWVKTSPQEWKWFEVRGGFGCKGQPACLWRTLKSINRAGLSTSAPLGVSWSDNPR